MRMLSGARTVVRAFGARGLARRVAYVAALRSGVLQRRTPQAPDLTRAPSVAWSFRFDLHHLRSAYSQLDDRTERQRSAVAAAKAMLGGELTLYGWARHQVDWPPRWHVNPFTGHEYPRVHWSEISDNDPEAGDIKDVWELSRLPFTTSFARAFVMTGDDRYPEAWWQAIEDWVRHNPPNTGVNWRCGQETSLRAIALCFGLSTFADHPSTTLQRLELAHRLLGASVDRVRPTLGYAMSQRNNHAISELVFLLSVLGPERELCRLLLEVLEDQFFPDGSYAQQSFTYQRLAVQALQWLLLTRNNLPPGLRFRVVDVVARSRDFLARCSDPVSGWLPNYGANDGALLFDFDGAHYRDFRPFLSSLGHRPSGASPSEAELWLRSDDIAAHRTDVAKQASTYLTLRGPRSLLLCRVGTNGHRAGHADQLAVDLWIDGQNFVRDPGTYRYNAPAPWSNALTGPEVHSTVRAPDESVTQVGRFLTEHMPDGRMLHRKAVTGGEVVVLERPAGPGTLERVITRLGDCYLVIDRPVGTDACVRWNLDRTAAASIRLEPEGSIAVSQPDEGDPTSGWVSDRYAERRACSATYLTVPRRSVSVAVFVPSCVALPPLENVTALLNSAVPHHFIRALQALWRPVEGE